MVVDGKPTEERIRYWVELVNSEYGLSDRNEKSVAFFEKIKGVCIFIDKDDYYICLLKSQDMWGYDYLSVVSYYIKQEARTLSKFREIQREINRVAKDEKICYILQGSHLNDKLQSVLGKMGYKQFTMIRRF